MKNLLFSVFAIVVASVAAMTATTAMLNAPRRAAPVALVEPSAGTPSPALPDTLAIEAGTPKDQPAEEQATGEGAESGKTAAGTDAAGSAAETESDPDPYAGITEEELPPDLQYSADSSVSFPTNI